VGAGAIAGAGLANRVGDRQGRLPGLGDGRPGAGQLPANRTPEQRRDALQNQLAGGEGRLGAGQLPARDWGQQRQEWQDHRDQVREDWQSHRDEARDDWQNWLGDNYGRYGGWYGGYASGYWGRWDYMWDNYPVAAAVGLTWRAANAIGYASGCSDYSNPYYEESMPAVYSEPVITPPAEPVQEVAGAPATPLPPGVSAEAVSKFDQARGAFFEGKYDEALKLTDAAVAQMPRDAVLHEFRSLVLFALQRYTESAATIHPVLDVGPGWDWPTLSGLYPNTEVYTNQLRSLEAARDKNPKAADLYFLLGYHYITCGHQEAALKMLRKAAELQPKDAVTASLVADLSPRDAKSTAPPEAAAPKPVPVDNVVGGWTAAGKGSASYSLTLGKDGKFTWGFNRGSRKQEAKGVYALEGNVLAMEPDTGGVLLAELTVKGQDGLHFKMIGGAKDDPGLDFRRRN
jgi:tetratricopeptide (TPR) repeat protein